MEITTIEEAQSTILKWLKENHHNMNEVKDNNSNFHYELDYPLGTQKKQRVIQPKDYPSLVLLLNGVSIAPEHMEKIKAMSEEERDSLYNEIRKDLIFSDCSYDMNLDESGIVRQVQFSYEFYFDTLTKTQLYRGLLLNYRTLLYFVTKFNDKFGIPVVDNAELLPEGDEHAR